MQIIPTPPQLAGAVWPVIKPFVEKVIAVCRGRRTSFDTLRDILNGQVGLWIVFDDEADQTMGFITTRVKEYDGFKLLGVELVSGDNLDAWEELAMETLIQFAKDQGCAGMEGYGRGAAWARRQKRYGWEPVFTTVEMMFDE